MVVSTVSALLVGFVVCLLSSVRERESPSSSVPGGAMTWGTMLGIAIIGVLALGWYGGSDDVDGTALFQQLTLPLIGGWLLGGVAGSAAARLVNLRGGEAPSSRSRPARLLHRWLRRGLLGPGTRSERRP